MKVKCVTKQHFDDLQSLTVVTYSYYSAALESKKPYIYTHTQFFSKNEKYDTKTTLLAAVFCNNTVNVIAI